MLQHHQRNLQHCLQCCRRDPWWCVRLHPGPPPPSMAANWPFLTFSPSTERTLWRRCLITTTCQLLSSYIGSGALLVTSSTGTSEAPRSRNYSMFAMLCHSPPPCTNPLHSHHYPRPLPLSRPLWSCGLPHFNATWPKFSTFFLFKNFHAFQ